MITESSVYLILKLDDFRAVLWIFTSITAGISFLSAIAWIINSDSCRNCKSFNNSIYKRYVFGALGIAFVFIIAVFMLPSTKQMAMIKVIPAIANSKIVGEMSADAKEIYRMGINAIKETLTGKEQEK